MNEYLYEIGVGDICESDLSDEEISISPNGENLIRWRNYDCGFQQKVAYQQKEKITEGEI